MAVNRSHIERDDIFAAGSPYHEIHYLRRTDKLAVLELRGVRHWRNRESLSKNPVGSRSALPETDSELYQPTIGLLKLKPSLSEDERPG